MNQVWLLFRALEMIFESICMAIHIAASLHFAEPMPHCLLFCGTFVGYLLLAFIRWVRLISGQRTLLHPAMFISLSGMLLHFICALLSMNYAENDFHLKYMGPQEELDHVFFGFCKRQSVVCIVTGAIYLLQAILLLDLIVKLTPNADLHPIQIITEPPARDDSFKKMTNEELDSLARTTADIYFLGKKVDYWLRGKSKWFRQLAGGQEMLEFNRANAERHDVSQTLSIDITIREFKDELTRHLPNDLNEEPKRDLAQTKSIGDLQEDVEDEDEDEDVAADDEKNIRR
ncbi:uncharacterized protein LOC115769695 [Drosophila novamexicana]|uniref:uncharacterized protein LOC115769695 n=1 Tax=Drosophila novamexicana TaxID=47314 RepID=UPI0011E595F3|nr:uncharacterized protein LOC115769695 [Drosophila novamexicana]